MRTPPLLMGAALLFWGWQTGYLPLAIPMAAALESTRRVRRRWELSPRDYYRISDLCAVVFLAMFAVRFLAGTASMARWLPFGLFPLLMAQALGTAGGVDRGALFYSARKWEKQNPQGPRRLLDCSWPGLFLVLLAASAANTRSPLFYGGIFLLAAGALWSVRPRRTHPAVWGVLLLAAGAAGWTGHVGLNRLHLLVEARTTDWFLQFMDRDRNPYRSTTALGEVGRIKLSNRIVLRVNPPGGAPPPPRLLRAASYNVYRSRRWLVAGARFRPVPPGAGEGVWDLSDRPGLAAVDVSGRRRGDSGILSLPSGTTRIENLTTAVRLETNPYGVVRVHTRPGVVRYRARYDAGAAWDAPPGAADRTVPAAERPAVEAVVGQLRLDGRPPRETVDRLKSYFKTGFTYSLDLSPAGWGRTPVENFLTRSRSGHCEFFATATVFLLRAAGVPARYATGYVVDEFSRLEGAYIVRARHAHAWVLAWIDGAWRDVDPTPPGWPQQEKADAPALEPLWDLLRFAGFGFSRWRWTGAGGGPPYAALWLVLPLGLVLVWRVGFRRRRSRVRKGASKARPGQGAPRVDSPYHRIDTTLAERGFARSPAETQRRRLDRIGDAGAAPEALAQLRELVAMHERLRYHPDGLDARRLTAFDRGVDAWMNRWRADPALFRGPGSGDGVNRPPEA